MLQNLKTKSQWSHNPVTKATTILNLVYKNHFRMDSHNILGQSLHEKSNFLGLTGPFGSWGECGADVP